MSGTELRVSDLTEKDRAFARFQIEHITHHAETGCEGCADILRNAFESWFPRTSITVAGHE